MIQRLFVYGTLAPGRPNEHVLSEIGGSWEAGDRDRNITPGRLGRGDGLSRESCWTNMATKFKDFYSARKKLSDHWARARRVRG